MKSEWEKKDLSQEEADGSDAHGRVWGKGAELPRLRV